MAAPLTADQELVSVFPFWLGAVVFWAVGRGPLSGSAFGPCVRALRRIRRDESADCAVTFARIGEVFPRKERVGMASGDAASAYATAPIN